MSNEQRCKWCRYFKIGKVGTDSWKCAKEGQERMFVETSPMKMDCESFVESISHIIAVGLVGSGIFDPFRLDSLKMKVVKEDE